MDEHATLEDNSNNSKDKTRKSEYYYYFYFYLVIARLDMNTKLKLLNAYVKYLEEL